MQGKTLDRWLDLAVIPTRRTMCRMLQVEDDEAIQIMAGMADRMPMPSARPRQGTWQMAADGFDRLARPVDTTIEARRVSPADGPTDVLIDAKREGIISSQEMRATALMLYSLEHMNVGCLVVARPAGARRTP